jgi:ATP-binding cassette subfamily B protein
MLRRTLPYLWPYRRQFAIHLGLTVAISALQLATPWPMKFLVDNVLGDQPLPQVLAQSPLGPWREDELVLVLAIVAFSILLATAIAGLNLWSSRISIRARQAVVLELKSDLFNAMQHQSLRYHNDRRLGDMMYRLNNAVWGIDELIVTIVPLIVAAVTFTGMFAIILYMNWQMALLSLIVLPLFYFTYVFYSKNFGWRVEEVQRLEGEALAIGQEVLGALPVVKAFTREEAEHSRFLRQGKAAKEARVKLVTQQSAYSVGVGFITTAATAVVTGFGAWQILRGRLTLGELLVIIAYLGSVYAPLRSIYSAFTYMHAYTAKIARVFEVLAAEPEIRDRPSARVLDKIEGRVAFEEVSFGYSGNRRVLEGISFEARPGEIVGIVGPTGAGKTSLVSLIPRFYDPTVWRVLIDGHDLRDIQLKSLRSQIGIVLQEPILLSGTIGENISYGRPEAVTEEIVAAARAANAHDFISALPEGYDTPVGERGVKLSGGERQRVSIARAFLKNAPILILDEPTSSVDYRTEAVILEALERLMVGRTTFIIAHRLSTIANADKIVVMQAGRIVEIGTHEELLAAGELYSDLYRKAAGGGPKKIAAAAVP